ncbi:MAG: DUF4276 family protein [Methylococcales bacterium]|nr:DUF4276 family protein [Methylococcales bacterium]
MEHEKPIKALIEMVNCQNSELINGGCDTAPSKRIKNHIVEYHKVTASVAVVKQIGLPVLRDKCRHFNEWLTPLENL